MTNERNARRKKSAQKKRAYKEKRALAANARFREDVYGPPSIPAGQILTSVMGIAVSFLQAFVDAVNRRADAHSALQDPDVIDIPASE